MITASDALRDALISNTIDLAVAGVIEDAEIPAIAQVIARTTNTAHRDIVARVRDKVQRRTTAIG